MNFLKSLHKINMKKITLESQSPSQCCEFGMIYSGSVPDPNFHPSYSRAGCGKKFRKIGQ
jgi:hypothetical protein